MEYVKQLSQKEQDYIYARLEHFFIKEGLTGEELQQAIQDGMDSKASDLEDIHGNTLYNECIVCEEVWNTLEHLGVEDFNLHDTDYENIRNHGQLYCVCSDCGGDDQPVLKDESKTNIENLEFNLTHQTAYGRSYMWAYHVYEGEKCVLSGGVYASQYPTRESALIQVKRELSRRLKLTADEVAQLVNQ